MRNCILVDITAEDLVVGDIVFLSAGDRVFADMCLIKTSDLFVSQAAITGESTVQKNMEAARPSLLSADIPQYIRQAKVSRK